MIQLSRRAKDPIAAEYILDFLDLYLQDKLNTVESESFASYRSQVEPFRAWWTDNAAALDYALSEREFRLFRRWLETDYRNVRGSPPAPGTVYSIVGRTRQWLTWLFTQGHLPVDVTDWLPLPNKPTPNKRFLSLDQCQALFDALPPGVLYPRDAALLAFLLATGARQFEAANVLWDSLSIEYSTGYGSCVLTKQKGDRRGRGKGRAVVFGPSTGRLMLAYRQYLDITRQWGSDDRIFAMSDNGIKMRFGVWAEAAGFDVTAHDCRRTFSDWWWEHNRERDPSKVLLKLQLGHSVRRDVTLAHYVNLDNRDRTIRMLQEIYVSPVESIRLE